VTAESVRTDGCCVCASRSARVVTRGPDVEYGTLGGAVFTVVRCEDCGHVYLDPLPKPEQLPEIYPPTYYTVNPDSPLHLRGFIYEHKLRRDVKRLLSQLDAARVRSVADLGCGDAQRLARLGEHLPAGCELLGVDLQPDPRRAEALAARGVELRRANLEEDLDVLRDAGHDGG